MSTTILDAEIALQKLAVQVLIDELGDDNIERPGKTYTPSAGKPWARLANLPAQPSPAGCGVDSDTLRTGIYQASLFFPRGEGSGRVLTLAQSICDAFKRGRYLIQNDTRVLVKSSGVGPFIPDKDNWLHLPVSIEWELRKADS